MERRQKILYVITKGTWGGAQRYVYDLATSLPQETFDVVVAFGQPGTLQQKLKDADIRTIPITRLARDINVFKDILSFFELISIFKKEKPDIVHLNSSKIAGLGALAARIAGIKKIIFTAHGFAFNEQRNIISRILIWLITWVTLLLCTETIVLGSREQYQAKKFPGVAKKISVIPNGIRNLEFKSREESKDFLRSKTSRPIPENIPWVGHIGELTANKGLDIAIAALSKTTEPFLFFIIGEGEERQALERQIEKNKLAHKVFLLGHIDDAASYLKAFDIFSLTSRKEGLPYVILEAGQAGLPVIASGVGNIPDIIEHNTSGVLVVPENRKYQNALTTLLRDSAKWPIYAQNLQSKVTQQFSHTDMVKKTIFLYQK